MIGILDYNMGNLGSVENACSFLRLPHRLVRTPEDLADCRAAILPGVGAFGDCMKHLSEHGFTEAVATWVGEDRPLLGICLGFQVLFEGSEESPGVPGLGLLPGRVRRFPGDLGLKVPHIGWNRVRQAQPGLPLFEGVPDRAFFYFVHSYYVDCEDAGVIAGTTEYGFPYTSAVCRGRLAAVQFHPEKSQRVGLAMLANFARAHHLMETD